MTSSQPWPLKMLAASTRAAVTALSAMFRQIIANNRAGGWRKVKADR
jgi:hypothetical protein